MLRFRELTSGMLKLELLKLGMLRLEVMKLNRLGPVLLRNELQDL